jgi:hypothetical protein
VILAVAARLSPPSARGTIRRLSETLEVSVVLRCLNKAETVATYVSKARRGLTDAGAEAAPPSRLLTSPEYPIVDRRRHAPPPSEVEQDDSASARIRACEGTPR